MEPKNIPPSESIRPFVQRRVTDGGICSTGEHVHDPIRSDLRHQTEERIDSLLIEGLQSGEPIEVTPEYWDAKRQKLSARLARKPTP